MCSTKLLFLFSSTKVHVHPEISKQPFLISTHVPKPNEFSFRWRNFRAFSLKLAQCNNGGAPISRLPLLRSASSSSSNFFQVLAKNVAIFVVGYFVFLGFCCSRPCLALSAGTVGSQTEYEDEEMLEKLLETEPGNMEAMKVVLYRKMRRGKTEEAVKYVEKLIAMEPQEVEWKLLQALCYDMMGQLTKAKRLFKDILKQRPLFVRALHGLAMVMHKNHEGPAVFDMLNEALEIARQEKRVTEERNIQVLIGQMHIVKGQFEEGLKIFQEMVDENPRDFRPYLCQGIIYSLMDKKEEAAEQFETYWSLAPEEFPQRGFLDDVVLAAQAKSRERLQKGFKSKPPYGN